MGKRFSGRRPEDQPMYVRPDQLDYEKRSLLVTSVSTVFKSVIKTIIEEKAADDGWVLDGGSSLIEIDDSMSIVIDGGASV